MQLSEIGAIVNTASFWLNIAALALTLFGVLLGIKRGILQSTFRLATVIAAAILSLIGARLLRTSAASLLQGFVDEKLTSNATVQELISASPTAKELIITLPGALAAPLVFLSLFLLLNLILYGVYKILKAITKPVKESASKTTFGKLQIGRLIGASISLVASFLIVACFLAPISGYISLADDVIKELEGVSIDAETDATIKDVDEAIITPLSDNTALKISGTLLNGVVFDAVTSYKINDRTVIWSDEAAYVANMYATAKPLVDTGFDLSKFSKTEADAIRALAAQFGDSDLIPHIIAELLPAMAEKWNKGDTFCGISDPAAATPEMLHPLMHSLYDVLETTTYETLPGDLNTVAELIAALSESGTFALFGSDLTAKDIVMTLSQPGLVSGLIDTLYANERMQLLVADIANIGFEAIGDSLEIPSDDAAVRTALSVELNEVVKKAEAIEGYDNKVSELSSDINDLFVKYGVPSDQATANLYAECIVGIGPITSSDAESTIVDYFDIISAAIGEELASMSTVTLLSVDKNVINAKVKEAVQAYIAATDPDTLKHTLSISNQLNGREELEHKVMTLDKIKINADEMFKMSPEALSKQSKSLEKIVTVIADVIEVDDAGNFSLNVNNLNTDLLAESLVDLGSTGKDEEGNTVNNLANAMTGVVKYSLYKVGIDAEAANNLVDHMTEEPKEGEEKKNPISSAVGVLNIVQNSKDTAPEDMKAHVTDLVKNLDPTTAKVLSDCISANLINSFVPNALERERTDALIAVIKDIINNFGESSDTLTDEQLDAETAYLQTIFDLAVNASSETEAVLFKSEAYPESRLGMTASEFLSSIEHSTVITKTFTNKKEELKLAVNDTMNPVDKAELVKAIAVDTVLSEDLKATLVYVFCLEAAAE